MVSPQQRRQCEQVGRWIAILGASLFVHAAVLSVLAAFPAAPEAPGLDAIDITFTVLDPEQPASTEPSLAPRPDEVDVPDELAAARPPISSRRRRAKPVPLGFAPVEVLAPPSEQSPKSPLLDPTNAARAFVISQEPLPAGPIGTGEPGAAPDPPDYFQGVGRKRYLSTREPPSLSGHGDGTYRYKGTGFKAVVEQDGSVTFDDGYRQSATVAFDITDHMMRKRGEDPYRVEKNWFLEGTEALRDELFERWRAKQTRIALQKLQSRLARISEDEALTLEQKEQRVIAMYRDTAADDAGLAARRAIVDFVAKQMPAMNLPADSR